MSEARTGVQLQQQEAATALVEGFLGTARPLDLPVEQDDPDVTTEEAEEVRTRVTEALATMAEVITHYGGTREKFIGDAIFAVFGWPQAHDDDAVRAAVAALHIRAAAWICSHDHHLLSDRSWNKTAQLTAAQHCRVVTAAFQQTCVSRPHLHCG